MWYNLLNHIYCLLFISLAKMYRYNKYCVCKLNKTDNYDKFHLMEGNKIKWPTSQQQQQKSCFLPIFGPEGLLGTRALALTLAIGGDDKVKCCEVRVQRGYGELSKAWTFVSTAERGLVCVLCRIPCPPYSNLRA